MRIDLTGKTALVTGSTAGIGYAIAKGLAQASARVIVNGRTQARVDAAVDRLRNLVERPEIEGVAADVGTVAGCARLTDAIPEVDILVNNTGIYEIKEFFEVPDVGWSKFFETNVMSGVRLSRHYLKGMLRSGTGRIVFISSESALNPSALTIPYGFSKTAQLAISRGLAELTVRTRVTVNAVLPGPTRAEGVETHLKAVAAQTGESEEAVADTFMAERYPNSLLGRIATPEEVANLVVYICSDHASATNGAALRVDGGIAKSIF